MSDINLLLLRSEYGSMIAKYALKTVFVSQTIIYTSELQTAEFEQTTTV